MPRHSTCSFAGCERKYFSTGFCVGHYQQHRRNEAMRPLRSWHGGKPPMATTCSFLGCTNGVPIRKGLCRAHYSQKAKGMTLRPLYETSRKPGTDPVIEFDMVACPRPDLDGPCHVFKAGKNPDGYGKVEFHGQTIGAHKYVWEAANGPSPDGMMVDHQCRNRACVNIKHLRLVTAQINSIENSVSLPAINAAKTHCHKGHPFDDENTYWMPGGGRSCRECARVTGRKGDANRRLKRKLAASPGQLF